VSSTITNNGSINVNAGTNTTEFYLNGGTVNLNGTGSIILNMTGTGGTAYIDGTGTLVNNNSFRAPATSAATTFPSSITARSPPTTARKG